MFKRSAGCAVRFIEPAHCFEGSSLRKEGTAYVARMNTGLHFCLQQLKRARSIANRKILLTGLEFEIRAANEESWKQGCALADISDRRFVEPHRLIGELDCICDVAGCECELQRPE